MHERAMSIFKKAVFWVFIAIVAAGSYFARDWGDALGGASSFGPSAIAAICPLGSLETLFASGEMIPRVILAFAVFLMVTLVAGRFFCGWLCPVPKLTALKRLLRTSNGSNAETADSAPAAAAPIARESAAAAAERAIHRFPAAEHGEQKALPRKVIAIHPAGRASDRLKLTPYAVLAAALASSFAFGFPVFCLICPVGLAFALIAAITGFAAFGTLTSSAFIFAGILLLEMVCLRHWCRDFCPLGALLSIASRINWFFRPVLNKKTCLKERGEVDCRLCRDACPQAIDLTQSPGTAELSRCTKCRKCAEACPTHSISFPSIALSGSASAQSARVAKIKLPERNAAERLKGFAESVEDLSPQAALEESARCLKCSACSRTCPQGNPIAHWIELIGKGKARAAGLEMMEDGRLGDICSRLCPQEDLCERACPLSHSSGPIAIGALMRYACDAAQVDASQLNRLRMLGSKKRVAIVGSGPAGLSCAQSLAQRGILATVFEAAPEPGGLLTHGIPGFKIDRSVVERHVALLKGLGVQFIYGKTVGRDVNAKALKKDFDAVFVACGAPKAVPLTVPGADAEGVISGLEFLAEVAGKSAPTLRGQKVVVLGGGATAVDCLRTALRLGAACVTCVARKSLDKLRAPRVDLKFALEEGAQILCEREVRKVLTNDSGAVASIELFACEESSTQTIPADCVVVAFGQRCHRAPWLEALGATFDDADRIISMNPAEGVFAGGDALRGPSLASFAAADGRAAARAIAQYLGVEPVKTSRIRKL